MTKYSLVVLFISLCYALLSQQSHNESFSTNDSLLISFGTIANESRERIEDNVSPNYNGAYVIANFWDVKRFPRLYRKYQYELNINFYVATESSKGRYRGDYVFKDKKNEVEVKWIFHFDSTLVNLTEFLLTLSEMASTPSIEYQNIFPEYQYIESFEQSGIKLDSICKIAQTVPKGLEATFLITTENGQGSGFFIDSDHAVSNYHVVGKEKVVTGRNHKGEEFDLRVIQTDSKNDLVILKSEEKYLSHYCFDLELPIDSITAGIEVFTIGSPASEELINTVSGGIISGIRRFDGIQIFQINAPVNPGNSGGPLIDSEGRLIGVVVAKVAGIATEGIAFAISKKQLLESFNIHPR